METIALLLLLLQMSGGVPKALDSRTCDCRGDLTALRCCASEAKEDGGVDASTTQMPEAEERNAVSTNVYVSFIVRGWATECENGLEKLFTCPLT
jgi:hypothetical protein